MRLNDYTRDELIQEVLELGPEKGQKLLEKKFLRRQAVYLKIDEENGERYLAYGTVKKVGIIIDYSVKVLLRFDESHRDVILDNLVFIDVGSYRHFVIGRREIYDTFSELGYETIEDFVVKNEHAFDIMHDIFQYINRFGDSYDRGNSKRRSRSRTPRRLFQKRTKRRKKRR